MKRLAVLIVALFLATPALAQVEMSASEADEKRIAQARERAIAEAEAAMATLESSEEPVPVASDMSFPADAAFKHSFDAYTSEAGKSNGAFARALAMHRALEEEGVEPDNIRTAIVVHGPAVFDVVNDARYGAKYQDEGGEPLRNQAYNDVAELIARGTEIWVCGVAAEYHGVGNADLLEGVKMAPSGTVAHAELQRRGFTINPY